MDTIFELEYEKGYKIGFAIGSQRQKKKDIKAFSRSLVKGFGLSQKEADDFLKDVFENSNLEIHGKEII